MPIENYPHPALTTHVVLLILRGDDNLQVLPIQRQKTPFEGTWGSPGGLVTVGESWEEAALGLVPTYATLRAQAGYAAARDRWWPVHDLPQPALDHGGIIDHACRRLRATLAESAENPRDSAAEDDDEQATGLPQSD